MRVYCIRDVDSICDNIVIVSAKEKCMEWSRYTTPSPVHPGMPLSPRCVCRDVVLTKRLVCVLSVFVLIQK